MRASSTISLALAGINCLPTIHPHCRRGANPERRFELATHGCTTPTSSLRSSWAGYGNQLTHLSPNYLEYRTAATPVRLPATSTP